MPKAIVSIDENQNLNGNYLEFETDGQNCIMYYSLNCNCFVLENRTTNSKTKFTDEQILQVFKNSFGLDDR